MSIATPSAHPLWLIPVLYILFAMSTFFRYRTLIFTFLAFGFYWILVLLRYIRGARSTLDYTYSYGGNVLTLVERSVSVLLFVKPEMDLNKIYRGRKARRDG
jgi:uncharacterized membrane protein YobD (UPF0266 family)